MSSHGDDEERLRRLFEGVWIGADPSVADELVAPEYVIHDRKLAEELAGPELYRALAEATRERFPDVSTTIDDVVAAVKTWTQSDVLGLLEQVGAMSGGVEE